jgi:carboxymethylenebutenolidase
VGLLGFSQGGFLAVAVAGANPKVQALVEFYGGVPTIVKHPITRLPPTFILHGEADEAVPVQEAYALETFVQTRAPSYAMKLYPGAPHGFDFELGGANSIDAKQRVVAFFAAHLRAPQE